MANAPTHFSRVSVSRDIAYGPSPWQQLDVYQPISTAVPRDTIVFFYGGRWSSGRRSDYGFVATAFANKGFNVVIPDYAKYPRVRFPTFVEDGAKAVAWVHNNAAKYFGTTDRIHVAGHSAGAHIAALLAADPGYLKAEGKLSRQVIASFAGLAGPYAFTPDEPDLEDMFGPPARYPAMQVTTFIDGQEPPMLLAWGDADTVVGRFNIDKLHASIISRGGNSSTIIYPHVGHVGILAALSWFNPYKVPVRDDLAAFFREAGARR